MCVVVPSALQNYVGERGAEAEFPAPPHRLIPHPRPRRAACGTSHVRFDREIQVQRALPLPASAHGETGKRACEPDAAYSHIPEMRLSGHSLPVSPFLLSMVVLLLLPRQAVEMESSVTHSRGGESKEPRHQ